MEQIIEHLNAEKDGLVDIRSVSIDPSLSKEDRIAAYLSQIKNPYHFMCGGIEVHARYSPDGPTLMECLKQLID